MASSSNADAGPSSAAEAKSLHAAFPSVAQYTRSSSTLPAPASPRVKLPSSPEELWALIVSAKTFPDISEYLFPVLVGITEDADKDKRAGGGPGMVALPDVELDGVSDEELHTHTLGLLYIINARFQRSNKAWAKLPELAMRLAVRADPAQLALAPLRVTEFAWSMLRVAHKCKETARALRALQALLRKTVRENCFNGVHAVFLEACLLLGNIELGYSSIQTQHLDVQQGTRYLDVLTYYYHAGTIAAVVADYDRAVGLLTFAAAMPGSSASAVQVAAAKRAVLCELLATGKQIVWPKDMSSAMSRPLEKGIEAYHNLAKAFAHHNWKGVNDAVRDHEMVYKKDCNYGLIQRITASITMRRILRLRKTYSRLALDELAKKVDAPVDDVKTVLEHMVAGKMLSAQVSSAPEVVTFIDDNDYASRDKMAELRDAQAAAEVFTKELVEANRAMALNRKWLTKQARNLESKDKGPIKSRDARDVGGDDIGQPPQMRGAGANISDMGF